MRMAKHTGDIRSGEPGKAEVVLKYLTPHSKWSIHSEFQDNLIMLTLFRGGPTMDQPQDAAKMGVKDNDWIEAFNRNGVVAARAVVSTASRRGHDHVPLPGQAPERPDLGGLGHRGAPRTP